MVSVLVRQLDRVHVDTRAAEFSTSHVRSVCLPHLPGSVFLLHTSHSSPQGCLQTYPQTAPRVYHSHSSNRNVQQPYRELFQQRFTCRWGFSFPEVSHFDGPTLDYHCDCDNSKRPFWASPPLLTQLWASRLPSHDVISFYSFSHFQVTTFILQL